MGCIYRTEIYKAKNWKKHFKIEGKIIFFLNNDVAVDVAQRESSIIKRDASRECVRS